MSEIDLHVGSATASNEPPPPLTVCGPAGRVTIELAAQPHTVGELADALGIPRRAVVVVDGRAVDRRVRLERSGIVNGSKVAGRPSRATCRPQRIGEAVLDDGAHHRLVVTVDAGPGAGAVVVLPPGRYLIGRSAGCAIRLDDPLAELHHAVLDVTATADATPPTLLQLAGRVPCRPADSAANSEAQAGGDDSPAESIVTIGASRVRVAVEGPDRRPAPPSAILAPTRGDPWRTTLHRPPRRQVEWAPPPIAPPSPDRVRPLRSAGGLLAGIVSVLGGVVLAVVMHHPMYLIFSCLGLVGAVTSALGSRVGDRRRRRRDAVESTRDRERFRREVLAQRDERADHERSTAPTIARVLRIVDELTSGLWSRRAGDPDAFAVSLGWGSMPWDVCLDGPTADLSPGAMSIIDRCALLNGVPVTAQLGSGRSIAVVGEHATAVARAIVIQLAVLTGPADWRLVVVADDPDEWSWAAWLPHAASGVGSDLGPMIAAADDGKRVAAILARLEGADDRHVVVVTDRPEVLATRTGAVRRYLAGAPSVAVIAVVPSGGAVPPLCRSELRIGSLCDGRFVVDGPPPGRPLSVHAAGVSAAVATDAARRLARIHDPEDPGEADQACPTSVALSRVVARCHATTLDDAIGIAARWRPGIRRARGADGHPRAAIGLTADGVVEIDLVADGPHALIAGTTGSGKSELLRTLVVTLAAASSPDDLTFVLVDYKGGSTFDACSELPHTVGVVTDLDDRLAERALVSLEAEIRRRERLLREAGADELDVYRAVAGSRPLPRLVVVIDEFATLAADLPGFLPALVGVAQRGRSLGIHLVLATQRPAGVVSDEIRANTNLRVALRLQDRADAVDIVGCDEPATFPRGLPGRAMLRLGAGETVVFQTAHSSGEHRLAHDNGLRVREPAERAGVTEHRSAADASASELAVLTRSIRAAASLCDVAPPFRPWLEPLASRLPASPADGSVGLVDEPAAQRQFALRWELGAGNLALIGSLGSGTTTAVRTLLVAAGPATHCYVVDGRGDESFDAIAALPNCGAVVGLHDAERRTRLVRYLADELARRQADPAVPRPPIILAIDGLGALLSAVSGPGDADDHGRWLRVLTDGAAAGIHTVATIERPGAVTHTALAALPQRWLFHVDDPIECASLGIRAAAVPPPVPGRIVIVESRLEAQLAIVTRPPGGAASAAAEPPVAIGTLGDDIDGRSLPRSSYHDTTTALSIGVDFATLGPSFLEVPDGEYVGVVGPARSGRSMALRRLITAWRDAHPDGVVVVHCPRPSSPVLTWAHDADERAVVIAADEQFVVSAVDGGARRVLVVVDDAERVADVGGRLSALANDRHANVTIAVAGRPDALRTMYGHWTAVVRRSRIGLVMSTGADIDGDLFGEPLPRRLTIAPRAGLAWMIDSGGRRLVQIGR